MPAKGPHTHGTPSATAEERDHEGSEPCLNKAQRKAKRTRRRGSMICRRGEDVSDNDDEEEEEEEGELKDDDGGIAWNALVGEDEPVGGDSSLL
jgi:hypothetical protein